MSSFILEVVQEINVTTTAEDGAFQNYTSYYAALLANYSSEIDQNCTATITDCYAPDVERTTYAECISSISQEMAYVAGILLDELNNLVLNCKTTHVSGYNGRF